MFKLFSSGSCCSCWFAAQNWLHFSGRQRDPNSSWSAWAFCYVERSWKYIKKYVSNLLPFTQERHDTTNATVSLRVTQEFFKVTNCSLCTLKNHILLLKLGMAAGQLVQMAASFPCSHTVAFVWMLSKFICKLPQDSMPCLLFAVLIHWHIRGDFSHVIRNVRTPDWFCKYKQLPKWWRIPASYACKNKKGGQGRGRTKGYVRDKRAGNLN